MVAVRCGKRDAWRGVLLCGTLRVRRACVCAVRDECARVGEMGKAMSSTVGDGIEQMVAAGRDLCKAIGEKAEAAYEPAQRIISTLFDRYIQDGKERIRYHALCARWQLIVSLSLALVSAIGWGTVAYGAPLVMPEGSPASGFIAFGVTIGLFAAFGAIGTAACAASCFFEAAKGRGEVTSDAVNAVVSQIRALRGK